MSKERPILFSGSMVNAILDGRKTMTRRVVDVSKIKPSIWTHEGLEAVRPVADLGTNHYDLWQAKTLRYYVWSKGFLCPYGKVGDRLWVREAFAGDDCMGALYRADFTVEEAAKLKTGELDDGEWCYRTWSPSIYMPRSVSRITLEITGVRVERLQDISEEDARDEGVEGLEVYPTNRGIFHRLWEKINGKKHPWVSNPFVWCISFRRIDKGNAKMVNK